jgi:ABC-type bacteriocin/lantibiotic exporter with double-glycine peptidase domain
MKSFQKALNLLPKTFQKKSYLFIAMLLISTLLEIAGIGIIFPLLELIVNGQFSKNLFGLELINYSSKFEIEKLLFYTIIFIIVLYFIKSIYLVCFFYWQNKFTQNIFKNMSENLFKTYLREPMQFYYKRNSSELIRNTLMECKNFGSLINLYLRLIVEIILVLGVGAVVFYIEPLKTLTVSIFLITFIFLFYFFTRKKIYEYGLVRTSTTSKKLKIIQESFGGIKDIKLKSSESFFINLYKLFLKKFTTAAYIQQTIIDSPRIVIEFIFIVILSIALLFYISEKYDLLQLFPIIGLYVVTSFRVIPSVLKILNYFQQIKGLKPSLEILDKEFKGLKFDEEIKNSSFEDFNFNKNIKVVNVNFAYNEKDNVLKDFSLNVKKNSCLGITGKSGEGKSTLADLIMGIISPDSGQILVDDQDIKKNIKGWQKNIGFVSQSIFLLDSSIKENIAFGIKKENVNTDLVDKALEDAQIKDFIFTLKDGIETEVGERGLRLSGGQIQRIGIARELYRKPSLLILDEATSGLDQETENEFLDCLEKIRNKMTIIIVSHRKNTLKNCDEIIEISKI